MTLTEVWDRLCRVRALSFAAGSASPTGWNGKGSGTVIVEPVADDIITYHESGVWRPEGGRDLRFTNVFRWSLAGEVLSLEHLRFGVDNPVYLFDLAMHGERELSSVTPHVCREDCYAARLLVHDDRIDLRWSVTGPQKQETIEYTYSW
jgi:Family of unknown function (DUF6314)